MYLEGKTALVTGGTRGLGLAIAQKLASEGALVAVNYAGNHDAAQQAVARIAASGGQAFAIQARLGGQAEAETLDAVLAAELQSRAGSALLDILVNNIGGGDYATIHDAQESYFDQTFNNNVRGAFFLTRVLIPRLADFGRVINISSAGSRLTDPGIIVYTMAKAALEAFNRVLAAELGPRGITVNAIAPGFTAGETNMHVFDDPVMKANVVDHTALRRFGTPEEIADAVLAFASPLTRWITAQTIEASGGFKL